MEWRLLAFRKFACFKHQLLFSSQSSVITEFIWAPFLPNSVLYVLNHRQIHYTVVAKYTAQYWEKNLHWIYSTINPTASWVTSHELHKFPVLQAFLRWLDVTENYEIKEAKCCRDVLALVSVATCLSGDSARCDQAEGLGVNTMTHLRCSSSSSTKPPTPQLHPHHVRTPWIKLEPDHDFY